MLKMNAKLVWKGNGPARRIAVTKAVAQAALDSQVIKDTNPLVPFRTGMLASSPDRAWGKMGTVIYDAPYAKRMYYGKDLKFRKTFHPLAGAFWFERAKNAWKDKWLALVARILGEK